MWIQRLISSNKLKKSDDIQVKRAVDAHCGFHHVTAKWVFSCRENRCLFWWLFWRRCWQYAFLLTTDTLNLYVLCVSCKHFYNTHHIMFRFHVMVLTSKPGNLRDRQNISYPYWWPQNLVFYRDQLTFLSFYSSHVNVKPGRCYRRA